MLLQRLSAAVRLAPPRHANPVIEQLEARIALSGVVVDSHVISADANEAPLLASQLVATHTTLSASREVALSGEPVILTASVRTDNGEAVNSGSIALLLDKRYWQFVTLREGKAQIEFTATGSGSAPAAALYEPLGSPYAEGRSELVRLQILSIPVQVSVDSLLV